MLPEQLTKDGESNRALYEQNERFCHRPHDMEVAKPVKEGGNRRTSQSTLKIPNAIRLPSLNFRERLDLWTKFITAVSMTASGLGRRTMTDVSRVHQAQSIAEPTFTVVVD